MVRDANEGKAFIREANRIVRASIHPAAVALPVEGSLPSLDGATGWLNSPPLTATGLRGNVVLIDFWTYTCINWLRTLPYVRAWAEKYKDQGLVVLGVHTPEFSFEHHVGQRPPGRQGHSRSSSSTLALMPTPSPSARSERTTTNAQEPIDELAEKLKRTELQHRPSSIPGREIVQVLTEIPAGVESGWHTHPGEEVGYILAGTVQMMIQGQPTLTLHAGDGFLIPPRTPHNALDVGPETGQMLSTYIVETGQPLASFVAGPP